MAIAQGRCLVGVNTSDNDFKTPEKTGGEKTHKLTVAEMPSHNHTYVRFMDNGISSEHFGIHYNIAAEWGTKFVDSKVSSTGSSSSHNNLQPYFTCYMFKRTS